MALGTNIDSRGSSNFDRNSGAGSNRSNTKSVATTSDSSKKSPWARLNTTRESSGFQSLHPYYASPRRTESLPNQELLESSYTTTGDDSETEGLKVPPPPQFNIPKIKLDLLGVAGEESVTDGLLIPSAPKDSHDSDLGSGSNEREAVLDVSPPPPLIRSREPYFMQDKDDGKSSHVDRKEEVAVFRRRRRSLVQGAQEKTTGWLDSSKRESWGNDSLSVDTSQHRYTNSPVTPKKGNEKFRSPSTVAIGTPENWKYPSPRQVYGQSSSTKLHITRSDSMQEFGSANTTPNSRYYERKTGASRPSSTSSFLDSPNNSLRRTKFHIDRVPDSVSKAVLEFNKEFQSKHQLKLVPISSRMTGDVSHVVAYGLIEPNARVLVLRPEDDSDPEHASAGRIFQEVDYYLGNKVRMVDVEDSHETYKFLIEPSRSRMDAYRAGYASTKVAEFKGSVQPYFKEKLESDLETHGARLQAYITDELHIAPNTVYKTVLWARLSGRKGVYPENDTSAPGILALSNIPVPGDNPVKRQVILAGDKHRTQFDIDALSLLKQREDVCDITEFWRRDSFKELTQELGLPSAVVQVLIFAKLDVDNHVSLHVSPRSGNIDKYSMILSSENNKFVQFTPKCSDFERITKLGEKNYYEILQTKSAMSPRGASVVTQIQRDRDVSERYGIQSQSQKVNDRFVEGMEKQSRYAMEKMSPKLIPVFRKSHEKFMQNSGIAKLAHSDVDRSLEALNETLGSRQAAEDTNDVVIFEMNPDDMETFTSKLQSIMFNQYCFDDRLERHAPR